MESTLVMPRRFAPRPVEPPPVVTSTRIAMIIVIATELMFFAGLIGAYLVFRLSARTWPPGDLPRLPIGVTALNSAVLFASLVPMRAALAAVHSDGRPALVSALGWTAALGTLFLLVQGFEWTRLVAHGLTLASGPYGASFYVLIGCHAVHVLIAVVWLAAVAALARRGRFTAPAHAGLEMCAMYWFFVCGLWALLFPLVYLY